MSEYIYIIRSKSLAKKSAINAIILGYFESRELAEKAIHEAHESQRDYLEVAKRTLNEPDSRLKEDIGPYIEEYRRKKKEAQNDI